jgi:uncharacterized protein
MKNKIVTNQKEIMEIIGKCQFCHVSMVGPDGKPYVIPMNFGFENGIIYLHSSRKGKKIDLLRSNPNVCIAFSTDHFLRYQSEDVACSYSMKYRSVLAHGKVEFVEDTDEKTSHLRIIMKNYTPKEFSFNLPAIHEVCCWKVIVSNFEGRVYGY